MWNPFKKKKAIDNQGNYSWTFQYVSGGFAINNSLRKDKSYKAIVWLGGFKFKLINVRKGNEATFFKSDDKLEYSTRLAFNKDLLDDVILPDKVYIEPDKYHLQNHKPLCAHYWTIDWDLNQSDQIMKCAHCGEFHEMKAR